MVCVHHIWLKRFKCIQFCKLSGYGLSGCGPSFWQYKLTFFQNLHKLFIQKSGKISDLINLKLIIMQHFGWVQVGGSYVPNIGILRQLCGIMYKVNLLPKRHVCVLFNCNSSYNLALIKKLNHQFAFLVFAQAKEFSNAKVLELCYDVKAWRKNIMLRVCATCMCVISYMAFHTNNWYKNVESRILWQYLFVISNVCKVNWNRRR